MLCYMYIDTGAGAWTRRVAIHARPMQGKKRRAGKMGSLFFLMWPPWEPTCFLQRRRCPCSSSRWFFCWWLKSRHCSFGRGAVGKWLQARNICRGASGFATIYCGFSALPDSPIL